MFYFLISLRCSLPSLKMWGRLWSKFGLCVSSWLIYNLILSIRIWFIPGIKMFFGFECTINYFIFIFFSNIGINWLMNTKITYIFVFNSKIWTDLKCASLIVPWIISSTCLRTSLRDASFGVSTQWSTRPRLISAYPTHLCWVNAFLFHMISKTAIWLNFCESFQNKWWRFFHNGDWIVFWAIDTILLFSFIKVTFNSINTCPSVDYRVSSSLFLWSGNSSMWT